MVGDSMMASNSMWGMGIGGDCILLVHEKYIYYIKVSEVYRRRTCR